MDDQIAKAREAFLNLIADAMVWADRAIGESQ